MRKRIYIYSKFKKDLLPGMPATTSSRNRTEESLSDLYLWPKADPVRPGGNCLRERVVRGNHQIDSAASSSRWRRLSPTVGHRSGLPKNTPAPPRSRGQNGAGVGAGELLLVDHSNCPQGPLRAPQSPVLSEPRPRVSPCLQPNRYTVQGSARADSPASRRARPSWARLLFGISQRDFGYICLHLRSVRCV
jgi:hypothetical protein